MLLTTQRWCFSPTELLNLARLNATDLLIAIYEQADLATSAMPRTYQVLIQRNGVVTDFFNNDEPGVTERMKREIAGDDIFFHDARWLGGFPREVTRLWATVLVTPTGELAAFANASVQKRYASQLTKYDINTSEFGGTIHTAITA